MPYIHIRHGSIQSCLCGEAIVKSYNILDKAQGKNNSRLMAVKMQEDLEDDNSTITLCKQCVGALY